MSAVAVGNPKGAPTHTTTRIISRRWLMQKDTLVGEWSLRAILDMMNADLREQGAPEGPRVVRAVDQTDVGVEMLREQGVDSPEDVVLLVVEAYEPE